ncbi:hypothetical protein [Bartonella sp. HY038]|uniref:hypothetical protein n=1 Tax=Bartonella sp. HY038 TaxID=2759660 RepID=UPI0015FB519D|nr:hypothetical protein [Bartonella sp. HY038]
MRDNEILKATKQNRKAILSGFATFMAILIGSGIFYISILLPFYGWATSIGPWGFFLIVMLAGVYIFAGYHISRYVYPKLQRFKTKNKEGLGSFRAFSFGVFIVLCYLIVLYTVLHYYNTLSELALYHFGFKLSELKYDSAVKVCIAILALCTLMIAVWRGALHSLQEKAQSKQAKIAADQIILGNRQFELANKQFELATENLIETQNNNIAKLLVDGTKFLGKDTTEAEKMAGLACLDNIIGGKSSFVKQAIDIIKSSIIAFSRENNEGIDIHDVSYTWFFYAMDILQKYSSVNDIKTSVYGVELTGYSKQKEDTYWPNLEEINYKNFSFQDIDFNDFPSFYIETCTFLNCKIDSAIRFKTKKIKDGSSTAWAKSLGQSHFLDCTFVNVTDQSYFSYGSHPSDVIHLFTDCYYDDSDMIGIGKIKFCENNGIIPLSQSSSSFL